MTSIPTAIYWAVVTITTVGYGDITPVTSMGQFISTLVMLLGYSVIAVPTGIVVGESIQEYRKGKPVDKNIVPEEFNEYDDKNKVEAGQDGEEVRYCPRCGNIEHEAGSRFCRFCGTLLSKERPSGWINDFFEG